MRRARRHRRVEDDSPVSLRRRRAHRRRRRGFQRLAVRVHQRHRHVHVGEFRTVLDSPEALHDDHDGCGWRCFDGFDGSFDGSLDGSFDGSFDGSLASRLGEDFLAVVATHRRGKCSSVGAVSQDVHEETEIVAREGG